MPQARSPDALGAPLVSRIDWADVEVRVRRQQRNREVHTPPISLYRWWARRSHALIGALLDVAAEASGQDSITVSDPFSGGGTVAVESLRRGFPTYAQDLHPWAVTGLATALDGADAATLRTAAGYLLKDLAPLRKQLYIRPCPTHGEHSEVLTTFWVRRTACPLCATAVFLFPYTLMTLDSRLEDESSGWWGCRSCGHATKSRLTIKNRRCGRCHVPLQSADTRLLADREVTCPDRACGHRFAAFDSTAEYRPVLVQRTCHDGPRRVVHFDRPTASDCEAAAVQTPDLPKAVREQIPDGLETRVLRRARLTRWSDLYTPRQLTVMTEAAKRVHRMDISGANRDRLLLALVGAAEMAGYVSRWDRYYPKAFEALANHRFAVTGLSCETNLLAERGRGTLPRRFRASARAAEWVGAELPSVPSPTWLPPRHRRTRLPAPGLSISAGTSERQRLHDSTVDLVLTDPPYFDDVQYAELAALFLTWARAAGLLAESVEVDIKSEAVANTSRGADVEQYRRLLTAIFRESRRTLKPQGRVLLTFHNTDVRAWWALARALRAAKLQINALAVSAAENDADHSKRGSLAFTKDLVIECGCTDDPGRPLVIAGMASDSEATELLAAGRCLRLGGSDSLPDFRARFQYLRGAVEPQRIGRRTRQDAEPDA